MIVAPSMLAADLADLRGALRHCADSGAQLLHWDVMDGHFVPNLSFGPPVIRAARAHSKLPFDVHLMVANPADYLPQLSGMGVELLSFQLETTHFAPRLIGLIRAAGIRPGVALNPQTPLGAVEPLLPLLDYVLLMSVEPGFGGQSFIPFVEGKIAALSALRAERSLRFRIEADGGITRANLGRLKQLGVDIAVTGSAFFGDSDPAGLIADAQTDAQPA